MSVSKRVRFEVLRRDSHVCQYCGGIAPDYVLTVDHVVPVALGGSDDPSNLVTACRDCNAGKTSIQPDAPLVERVSAATAMFALGLRDALAEQGDAVLAELEAVDAFEKCWATYVPQHKRTSWHLPDGYADTVMRWHRMGVTEATFEYAIRIALAKKDVVGSGKFLYTAGIIWNVIRKAEAQAAPPKRNDEPDPQYEAGWDDGENYARGMARQYDYLALHIDGLGAASDYYRYSEAYGTFVAPTSLHDLETFPRAQFRHYARPVA